MSEQPEGIEHSVDAAIADQDHLDPDPDTDLQTPASDRRDPDDPTASMRESVEESHGE
jgi:hypothetical protein